MYEAIIISQQIRDKTFNKISGQFPVDQVKSKLTDQNIIPLNGDVLIALESALFMQKSYGVHQFMNHCALSCYTAGYLKVHILPTTYSSHTAPTTTIASRDPDVIGLLAVVRLESDTRVLMVIVHCLVNQSALFGICKSDSQLNTKVFLVHTLWGHDSRLISRVRSFFKWRFVRINNFNWP